MLCVASAGGQTSTRPAERTALAADRALERRLTRQLGPLFNVHRTPHFSILSDAEDGQIERLKGTVEETQADVVALAHRLSLQYSTPPAKMTVVFFGRWKHYERRAKEAGFHVSPAMPGFFSDRDNQCLIFNFANAGLLQAKRREVIVASMQLSAEEARATPGDKAARRKFDERRRRIREMESLIREHERLITETVVRHEIAHQVLFNLGLQPATTSHLRWLREGLAMQFETREAVNRHRITDFLATASGDHGLGLRVLVGDPKHIGPGAEDLPARYAKAWALVAHLIERQPKQFSAYLEKQGRMTSIPSNPATVVSRFEASFGKLDRGFESALTAWASGHVRPEP